MVDSLTILSCDWLIVTILSCDWLQVLERARRKERARARRAQREILSEVASVTLHIR